MSYFLFTKIAFFFFFHSNRFRNSMAEIELTVDVIPHFRDDVQLSVSEYRSKLYDLMSSVSSLNSRTSSKASTELSSSPSMKSDTPASIGFDESSKSKNTKINKNYVDSQNEVKSYKKRLVRSNSTTSACGATDHPQTQYLHSHSMLTRSPLEKPLTRLDGRKTESYAKNSSQTTYYKSNSRNQLVNSTFSKQNKPLTMPQLNNANTTMKKSSVDFNTNAGRRRCMVHSNSLDSKLITRADGYYDINGMLVSKNYAALGNDQKNENNTKCHALSNIQYRPKPTSIYGSVTAKYLEPNGVTEKKQTNALQEDAFEVNSRLKTLVNKIRNHKAKVLKK